MTFTQILQTLKKRFWLVIAGALIAGVAAAVLSIVWPRSYEAEAQLLMTKLRPDLTLDPQFETVSGENVVNESIQQDQVRLQTLIGLASSADLTVDVLSRLQDVLPAGEQTRGYLKGVTKTFSEGNLIIFRVRADSPQKAADVANAWAQAYEERVNRLYSATSPSGAEIQQQVVAAQTSYEKAKSAVETFLQQNQEDELTRQIEQKKQILDDLQTSQLEAAKARESTLLSYVNQIDQLLLQAQGLKQKLASTAATTILTAGEQFSLFSLESSAFSSLSSLSSQGEVPVTLEVGQSLPLDGNLTAGQAIEHLDRLVEAAKTAQATAQSELDDLSANLLGSKELVALGSASDTIATLQSEINALQAELDHEQTTKKDLTDARDVAQQGYLALVRKAAEVQISSQLTGVEVQLAAAAQPPESPAFPQPMLNTALGVVAGGLAGLALAFVWELWPRQEKGAQGRSHATSV